MAHVNPSRFFNLFPVLRYADVQYVISVIACFAAMTATPIVASIVTGQLVRAVAEAKGAPSGHAWLMLALFVVVTLLGWIASTLLGPLTTLVAKQADGGVREKLLALAARPFALADIESAECADDLARVVENTEGFGRSMGRAAVTQIENSCKILCAVGLCLVIAAVSPVLALLLFTGVMTIRWSLIRRLSSGQTEMDHNIDALRRGRYLFDLVCGQPAAKEVRTFGFGSWVVDRCDSELGAYNESVFALRRGLALREASLLPAIFGLSLAAFVWPAVAVLDHHASLQAMSTAVMASIALFTAVQAGAEQVLVTPARLALGALNRLDRKVGRERAAGTVRIEPAGPPPRIVYSGVDFRYQDGAPVLKGLDLEIVPGEVLAIVGENGSGKTTLIKLLAGLYEPSEGRITIDGIPLSDLEPESWRATLGVVFQDFARYQLSLRENVAVAAVPRSADRADEEEKLLRSALEDADAAMLTANLPAGWDTPLSRSRTGGAELSGGQWQKIAIARALFAVRAGARVLVLDEPTAHLDIHAELEFFSRIVSQVTGVTVVLISHRLSTVRQADRIVTLTSGCIGESGTHEELLAAGGAYAEMFNAQASRFRENNVQGDGQ